MHNNQQRNGNSAKVNPICANIKNIIRFQTIDSTHSHAIRLAEKGDSDECIIVSEKQTSGVGRCGRKWISDSGNLFVSILIKAYSDFFEKSHDLGKLSLTVACAVRETIFYYINDSIDLSLHWPNDIYYKGKKISGILFSTINDYLIISVGINVNSSPHLECRDTICIWDILECKEMIDISKTLNVLLKNIDDWFYSLTTRGFLYIKSYWLLNINKINCKVTIKNGSDSISGIFSDIDDYGRLVLEKCGKRLFISSGDLFVNHEGIIIKND